MIDITYSRDRNHVTVTGHAMAGKMGEDLVCAAATIITRTLAANVADLSAMKIVHDPVILLQAGNAEISCKCHKKKKDMVEVIFSSVAKGYEILANQYPEYVSYTEV